MTEYNFEACKYHGKWAVYSRMTGTFDCIGKGRRWCERKARELNGKFGPLTDEDRRIMRRFAEED